MVHVYENVLVVMSFSMQTGTFSRQNVDGASSVGNMVRTDALESSRADGGNNASNSTFKIRLVYA